MLAFLAFGLAIVSGFTPVHASCNQDNCLRAVIASAYSTRAGTTDCASYFRTTVTPATVTYTATLTQLSSTTISGTAVVVTTSTLIQPITLTQQTSTTSIETDFATVTVAPIQKRDENEDLAKRQQTVLPSNIPAYASPCSGAVRYSSACSCVGATHVTITAAAPSTTITVTQVSIQTSTYSTTTTSTTVETDLSTIIDLQTNTILSTTTSTTTTTNAPRPTYKSCTGPPFNSPGTGGCSSSCFCDISVGSSNMGFCDNAAGCGGSCNTDADCPLYFACTSGHPECGSANVCLDFSGCVESVKMMMRGVGYERGVVELLRGVNVNGTVGS